MRYNEVTAAQRGLFGEVGVSPQIRRLFIIPGESAAFVNSVNTDVTEPLWTACCSNRTAAASAEPEPTALNRPYRAQQMAPGLFNLSNDGGGAAPRLIRRREALPDGERRCASSCQASVRSSVCVPGRRRVAAFAR